jgi:hypothetical protein
MMQALRDYSDDGIIILRVHHGKCCISNHLCLQFFFIKIKFFCGKVKVEGRAVLYMLKEVPHHKDTWGSVGIAP